MKMDKSAMFDKALDMLMGDMDDMEGKSAMSHSIEDCDDPLGCTMHDSEAGEGLTSEPSVKIEVKKVGMPSLEGKSESKAEEGLSPEEAEQLRKLLK